MRRLCMALAVTAAVTAAYPVGARADQDIVVAGPSEPVPGQTLTLLIQAVDLAKKHDVAKALPLIRRVLDAPDFASLTSANQHVALYIGGYVELMTQNPAAAIPLLTRSTGMPEADANDWMTMLGAAEALRDGVAAAGAVATLARRWPEELNQREKPHTVSYAINLLQSGPDARAARLDVLSALYDARWPEGRFTDWSAFWRDLALMLLEDGDPGRASEVAKSIRVPSIVASVRVDRRFDSIVSKDPETFDVGKTMDDFIAEARSRVAAHPDRLEALAGLARALIQAGRDREALALIDDGLARAQGAHPGFSDVVDQLEWLQNARANALTHLGRSEEAVATMRAAMEHAEDGQANISQVVNLAGLLNRLGRPKEALEVIARVGPGSAYGQLAADETRLGAYVQLGEKDKIAGILANARVHAKDAPGIVEEMLIEVGDLDGAAALYVQRLNDPAMRDQALLAMQHWLDTGAKTPVGDEFDRREAQVQDGPEVQAAIKAVGRVETFPYRED